MRPWQGNNVNFPLTVDLTTYAYKMALVTVLEYIIYLY